MNDRTPMEELRAEIAELRERIVALEQAALVDVSEIQITPGRVHPSREGGLVR